MKFLCLHGAFASAKTFRAQLTPFIDELEQRTSHSFEWINGAHETTPPQGFENYFGAPPLYRHIKLDCLGGTDVLTKIRDMPKGDTAEDAIRKLLQGANASSAKEINKTMRRLFNILDQDPDIDGIIGYSEGAGVASSIILEDKRRWEEEGIPRRIKAAVFFTGFPPIKVVDGSVKTLLSDDCEDVIDIPTFHIIGCSDPFIDGAMALFNLCDEDSAMLFDHGYGHVLPRDKRTVTELASQVDEFFREKGVE